MEHAQNVTNSLLSLPSPPSGYEEFSLIVTHIHDSSTSGVDRVGQERRVGTLDPNRSIRFRHFRRLDSLQCRLLL